MSAFTFALSISRTTFLSGFFFMIYHLAIKPCVYQVAAYLSCLVFYSASQVRRTFLDSHRFVFSFGLFISRLVSLDFSRLDFVSRQCFFSTCIRLDFFSSLSLSSSSRISGYLGPWICPGDLYYMFYLSYRVAIFRHHQVSSWNMSYLVSLSGFLSSCLDLVCYSGRSHCKNIVSFQFKAQRVYPPHHPASLRWVVDFSTYICASNPNSPGNSLSPWSSRATCKLGKLLHDLHRDAPRITRPVDHRSHDYLQVIL